MIHGNDTSRQDGGSRIILTDANGKPKPKGEWKSNQKPTEARIINSTRVAESAGKALHLEHLYLKYDMALVETPLGYILVTNEGDHRKIPFLKDEKVNVLVFNRMTGLPVAECPASMGDLLAFTDRTMPIAVFVSNQDGLEEKWRDLLVTFWQCGMDTKADERLRFELNEKKMILGGAEPFDPSKI